MHTKYHETVDTVVAWSEEEHNVEGSIIIGSQVRSGLGADKWSDLDLMLLLNDYHILLEDNTWVQRFGKAVCVFDYITPLHFVDWDWCVKRVLFDDNRDVDFCLLPYDQLDDVLAINKDIIAQGYRVIYDSHTNLLGSKIRAILETRKEKKTKIPTEEELNNDIGDLLFHIIWAFKKIKRKELWVAVSDINGHIRDLLLRLIEFHNASVTRKSSMVMYDGRFLEDRTDREIIDQLRHCFTKYDEMDAINTLSHLIDITFFVSKEIFEEYGYRLNTNQFEMIRKIYDEMKGGA